MTGRASPRVKADLCWPATLPREVGLSAASALEAAGVEVTCRVQPVRRGVESAAEVLLTSSVLAPFLSTVFERLAADACTGLRDWVQSLLGTGQERAGARAVVFENEVTGAEFVFTAGLPAEAFRAAVEQGAEVEPGRWTWDASGREWVRFESGRRSRAGQEER
ncbi:hypothetical protein GCM10023328_31510 [Modestobacter marinus]|uniref:Uncharacterized protein n=1 Tax=Modestobacter marinus TaxID=477641 RepID=A0A846LNF8_9ACTN|nr:hypothetical protein [Modestobacter marinus]NIH68024.1 hypothetical protein [Modestobacter marinus]GGL69379.1 hypothetical protein GCM10011589_27170 [Modestobacter marinus]